MMTLKKNLPLKKVIIAGAIVSILVIAFNINKEMNTVTAGDLQITDSTDPNTKKKQFFDFMRPIVNAENAKIVTLRKKLLIAKESNHQKRFVEKIARQYKIDWSDDNEDWDALLNRVDAIALELVLAQSANESAWGQSRFAQEGNNFFGQWCYQEGCGLVPKNRHQKKTHEVARFNNVNESVRSYIKNINTGQVYKPLREVREKNRAAGNPADPIAQAGGLIKYSERREAYVNDIRKMIKNNEDFMLEY